ncbi:MAG TPA: protein adenylyltransferase SelO family protein [Allosphingosinicella sp.]|nr:protein adenylyltransferase SelO family protein [Allosphingosinicella sp.]
MPQLPAPSAYTPDPQILALGDAFYDPVDASDFPQTILRFRNDRWAPSVGLGDLADEDWIAHFGRFRPLPGNLERPLALRYHGHQFRVYNPDIGDGRGFLFAQLRDGHARLLDLGTKGSGRTPWSRRGDGRLTLKGGMREILATEMLEALGAETSKTFSLVETGEALDRGDEPSPTRSAVLVRLQHSHIRIGTFQRLAYSEETENIAKLVAYCLEHYYPHTRHCEERSDEAIQRTSDEKEEAGLLRSTRNDEGAGSGGGRGDDAVLLLRNVVREGARLAADYIAAGFVHGVLNSDNIAITCESFDYGPWRFTPFWDGHFTAAYFDHAGLYSFGRQPEAIHWDILQLARSLTLVADLEALRAELERFPELFQQALVKAVFARLGIVPTGEARDAELLTAMETAMVTQTVKIDRFFFDWRGGRRRGPSPADAAYGEEAFAEFVRRIAEYEAAPGALDHAYWSAPEPQSMHIEEVEAIWSRIDEADDWSALHAKVAAVRRMGEAHRGSVSPAA